MLPGSHQPRRHWSPGRYPWLFLGTTWGWEEIPCTKLNKTLDFMGFFYGTYIMGFDGDLMGLNGT